MLTTPLFGFGAHSSYADRDELLALTAIADDAGLDVFSLSDHPYNGNRLDAYATLGFVLGRTQRLAGFANVTSLPTRPAPMLARAVATLAALSDDRVVLGLGAGGLPDRAAAMGFERPTPSAAVGALAEAIELVRRLCQNGTAAERSVTMHGKHYRVDAVDPAPVAVPPIWTGSVGPRSLAVTGRLADGWIPGHAADWLSPRFRESRPIIDEAAAAAGREPRSVRTVFNLPGRITPNPLSSTRDDEGRWRGGSADQWIEELVAAVQEHAASGFLLFSPTGGTPDRNSLQRWVGDIVPAVREATTGVTAD